MNFCPKCGNDVRDSKFCSKCGTPTDLAPPLQPQKKKGFFQKIKEENEKQRKAIAEEKSRKMAEQFVAERERIREREEFEKKIEIFEAAQKDTDFQNDVKVYWQLHHEIETRYSVLTNMPDGFNSPASDALLQLCQTHIILNKRLRPKWEKYGYPQVKTIAYKREAMILEKQKAYYPAAHICMLAIKDDHLDDGTSGGMVGRMMRMLKKSGQKPSPEMMEIIEKTLE